MAPITGVAHISYLPAERVVGGAKLARVVDCIARRPQIRERMAAEVAAIIEMFQPREVTVVIERPCLHVDVRRRRDDDHGPNAGPVQAGPSASKRIPRFDPQPAGMEVWPCPSNRRPGVARMNTAQAKTIAYENMDDKGLVELARSGDDAVFRTIMQRHNRRLYRVARGILGDDPDAEDVVQEAYVKAFENLARFRGDSSLATWLTRIAINEALGRKRKAPPNNGSQQGRHPR
jgi:GTP cyclohydrolase I/Sigma-70 region 2